MGGGCWVEGGTDGRPFQFQDELQLVNGRAMTKPFASTGEPIRVVIFGTFESGGPPNAFVRTENPVKPSKTR